MPKKTPEEKAARKAERQGGREPGAEAGGDAFEVSSISPDLVSGEAKVVISAAEGRANVTLNRIDISDLGTASGDEMRAQLLQRAKELLEQALQVVGEG